MNYALKRNVDTRYSNAVAQVFMDRLLLAFTTGKPLHVKVTITGPGKASEGVWVRIRSIDLEDQRILGQLDNVPAQDWGDLVLGSRIVLDFEHIWDLSEI